VLSELDHDIDDLKRDSSDLQRPAKKDQFIDYRKERQERGKTAPKKKRFFSIEQIKKHTEEAMMLKFKTKVFQGIADKVKDFQNNERPI
jgi:hypothetical protein